MKWEAERWRKLYRRPEGTWLLLPVLARGLGSELLKYADDDGRIPALAGEGTGDTVCILLGARRAEWKAICGCIEALLADGFIIREPTAILIRNFTKAQVRSSNAERQARYRKRHQDTGEEEVSGGDVPAEVTPGDVTRDVTGNVTSNGQSNATVTETLSSLVTDRALLSLSSGSASGSLTADPRNLPVSARTESETRAKTGEQAALFADPIPKPRARRQPKPPASEVPMPADWQPTEAHRAFAAKHGLNLETEAFGFRGWAEDKMQVSWNGAFSTRLANRVNWREDAAKSSGRPGPPRGALPQPGPMQVANKGHVPPEEQLETLV